MVTKEAIRTWFMGLQDDICASLEILDGEGEFQEDLCRGCVRPKGDYKITKTKNRNLFLF